jgi:transcriptional regulator with XRE-family HTH domain
MHRPAELGPLYYLDTSTGEVKRGQVAPADRVHLRSWLARFAGCDDVAFALEGCTGWRYVAEELAAAGITAHEAPPRSIGQVIRDLRQRRGMSLRDLAATGLSPSYISNVERGAASPSIASLQKLGAAFGSNAITLMSGSYEAPESPVVRKGKRRVLDSDKGVRIEDLSTAGSNLEPLIFTLDKGKPPSMPSGRELAPPVALAAVGALLPRISQAFTAPTSGSGKPGRRPAPKV